MMKVREIFCWKLHLGKESAFVAVRQCMYLGIIGAFLKNMEDPGYVTTDLAAEGVSLGVDEPLPRTPAIF